MKNMKEKEVLQWLEKAFNDSKEMVWLDVWQTERTDKYDSFEDWRKQVFNVGQERK